MTDRLITAGIVLAALVAALVAGLAVLYALTAT